MLRRLVAAVWLVVACLVANATTAVDTTAPSVIHDPIQYPSSAVSAGVEGTVLVAAEVDAGGRVVGARVEKSSGQPALDAAALRGIPGWSFVPGTKDGKPMAQWVAVPIRFQMKPETTGGAALLKALPAMASIQLIALGSLIWFAGFVWSIVLAKRKSILWLSGMVALWVVTYPLYVAMHWSSAKRNLVVVSLGIAALCLGLYLAPSPRLSI